MGDEYESEFISASFQPLTIRGVTLKNRLEYAPTVVLKCNADGTVGQDMLDFMPGRHKQVQVG